MQVAPLPRSAASSSASAGVSSPSTRDDQAAVGAAPDPLDQRRDVAARGQPHLGEVVEQRALAAGLGGVDVDRRRR